MVKHHTQRFVEDGALFALVGLECGLYVAVRAILYLINALPGVGRLMAATAG